MSLVSSPLPRLDTTFSIKPALLSSMAYRYPTQAPDHTGGVHPPQQQPGQPAYGQQPGGQPAYGQQQQQQPGYGAPMQQQQQQQHQNQGYGAPPQYGQQPQYEQSTQGAYYGGSHQGQPQAFSPSAAGGFPAQPAQPGYGGGYASQPGPAAAPPAYAPAPGPSFPQAYTAPQSGYGPPPPQHPSVPPPPNPNAGYGAPPGAYPPPPMQQKPKQPEIDYPPQMDEDGPAAYGGGSFQYPGGAAPATLTPGQPGWDPRTAHPLPPPGGQGQQHAPMPMQPGQQQQYSGAPQQQPLQAQQGPAIPPWARLPHPKYVSLTCSAMPNSNAVRTRANVPLGVILRPLADPPSSASAQPLPLINPTATGVIRCRECRAYINPFVQFLNGGAQWRCNLCKFTNDVPQSYFSSLDHTGRRNDLDHRPELVHGSLEIVAPVDYMVRQPMPPVYFFVIDVSESSVKSGMLATLCDTIMTCLERLPGDKRTLVGFITFDSTVHFYTLKAGEANGPQMFVMADLDDVFLPQPADLLVNLDESRAQVIQLVTSLASMHSKTRDVEAALGPALEGALQVMSRIGGKMLVFLSGLPSLGEGRLINRENTRALGTDKEHALLATPSVDFYKRHAIKLTKYQICADLFLFHSDLNANASFLDIATISDLNKLTGGQLYYYPNYSSALHANKFTKELTRCLIRTQGWEAVVRVRVSKGVRISEFHGNFFMRGADLLALPGIDSDKAFAFELKNDESLITNPTISIQSALLYTTSSGERRIRVHTTCIPVTQSIGELFERVNVNAITNLLAKQAIIGVYKEGFEKAREFIRNRCVALLRTHRTALAKQQAAPSTELNVLPLMTLGLLKNAAFKEGAELRTDARAYLLASMYTMGIVEMETFVRPRMLPVHDMQGQVGLPKEPTKPPTVNADGTLAPVPVQTIELPSEAGLTAEVLKSDTAFLVDNGMDFLLRVGRQVSADWTMSVFGLPSLEGVDSRQLVLQTPSPSDTSSPLRRLTNILGYLREVSPLYQQLYVLKEGEATELKFFNMLIEDRNMSAMSLAEFDGFIHRAGTF